MPQTPSPAAVQPLKEGARWRHAKPSSDEVSKWFEKVPIEEGLSRADYVSGVVIIPASEKVKRPKADGRGTEEVWEQTFTPYVRVDTRVAYFWALAEHRELVGVVEPVQVPRAADAAFRNEHMPEGFWWHIAGEQGDAQRFLCATWRVALYRREDWYGPESNELPRPVREGRGTKAVTGSPDINGLARAETGAIGRALGVAGILVVGTGIATAEDMQELSEPQQAAPVTLPAAGDAEESPEQLNERLGRLEAALRPHADAFREFTNWWAERARASGWQRVGDAPVEARRGVATKIEQMLAELPPLPAAEEPA